jgi:hypothetical protein
MMLPLRVEGHLISPKAPVSCWKAMRRRSASHSENGSTGIRSQCHQQGSFHGEIIRRDKACPEPCGSGQAELAKSCHDEVLVRTKTRTATRVHPEGLSLRLKGGDSRLHNKRKHRNTIPVFPKNLLHRPHRTMSECLFVRKLPTPPLLFQRKCV